MRYALGILGLVLLGTGLIASIIGFFGGPEWTLWLANATGVAPFKLSTTSNCLAWAILLVSVFLQQSKK